MLDNIYYNRNSLLGFTLIAFLLSLALSAIATFGAIGKSIDYIIFLPLSFIYFVSCFLGFLIVAENDPQQPKLKVYYSIQTDAFLFASLLLPLAIYFLYS